MIFSVQLFSRLGKKGFIVVVTHFNLRNQVLWDVTPCSMFSVTKYEDGGGMSLRNDSKYLPFDAAYCLKLLEYLPSIHREARTF
jgi:hypothetical protein